MSFGDPYTGLRRPSTRAKPRISVRRPVPGRIGASRRSPGRPSRPAWEERRRATAPVPRNGRHGRHRVIRDGAIRDGVPGPPRENALKNAVKNAVKKCLKFLLVSCREESVFNRVPEQGAKFFGTYMAPFFSPAPDGPMRRCKIKAIHASPAIMRNPGTPTPDSDTPCRCAWQAFPSIGGPTLRPPRSCLNSSEGSDGQIGRRGHPKNLRATVSIPACPTATASSWISGHKGPDRGVRPDQWRLPGSCGTEDDGGDLLVASNFQALEILQKRIANIPGQIPGPSMMSGCESQVPPECIGENPSQRRHLGPDVPGVPILGIDHLRRGKVAP